jgi:hypothetical protein
VYESGGTFYPTEATALSEADGAERAEAIRRTAARFAGNSARARGSMATRTDDELGASSRGGHRNG